MKVHETLPFSLSTESLAAWLDTLASLPPVSAANQLYQILKLLQAPELEPRLIYPLLVNLTQPCMYLSSSFSSFSEAESDQKLIAKQVKIAKLGIKLLKELALSFCTLVEKKQIESSQMQSAIHYALQIIGYCLRSCYLINEMPSSSLWKKSAVLYRVAFKSNCLEQALTPKIHEFKAQNTIISAVRRNLLFCIIAPIRFSPVEINELFQLSNKHYELLDIYRNELGESSFFWNLEGEEPSAAKNANQYMSKGFIAIGCRRFAETLKPGAIETSLKQSTLTRIAMRLSGYQPIYDSILADIAFTSQLIIGYAGICNYYQEQSKLQKVKQLGNLPPKAKVLIENLAIEPLEHEKKIQEKNTYELSKLATKQVIFGNKVKLFRTGSNLFVVAENCPAESNTDDISLIFNEQQPPMLAVLRRKLQHSVTCVTRLLFEYIPGSISIYTFKTDTGVSSPILIINETGEKPEALLPPGKYGVDNIIVLNTGKNLYLQACAEYNSFFCRFRVRFDS